MLLNIELHFHLLKGCVLGKIISSLNAGFHSNSETINGHSTEGARTRAKGRDGLAKEALSGIRTKQVYSV